MAAVKKEVATRGKFDNSRRKSKKTSIGKSVNTRFKSKDQKRNCKKYRGQGS